MTDLSGELEGFNLFFSSVATRISDLKSSDNIDTLPSVGSSACFLIDEEFLSALSDGLKQF